MDKNLLLKKGKELFVMTLKEQQEKIRERLKEAQKNITETVSETIAKLAIGKNIEKQISNLQKGIELSVKLVLQALDVPTRKEINDLEKKLDTIAAKLDKLSGDKKKGKGKGVGKKKDEQK
jgi:tetrahydromethanopterin S-methyltransferase subunit G